MMGGGGMGGVKIKGDSSIFSQSGFVGQGGSTNVFSSDGGGVGGMGGSGGGAPISRPPPPSQPAAQSARSAQPRPPASRPPPPPSGPSLDFLTQAGTDSAAPPSYDDNTNQNNDDNNTNQYGDYPSEQAQGPPPGKRMSDVYAEQGVDILSGGQEGFGAVKGIEKKAGDFSQRDSRGSYGGGGGGGEAGNTGTSVGGDFGAPRSRGQRQGTVGSQGNAVGGSFSTGPRGIRGGF